MELRDYQLKLANEIRALIAQGHHRILVQLPTGGGKTPLAAYIVKRTTDKMNRAIMTAHRSEICSQIEKALTEFDVDYGRIQAGLPLDSAKMAHVASILTLRNKINRVEPPRIIIIDEAHHSVSRTWKEVIDHYTGQGAIAIGLSATPRRLSGESLKSCYDVMVQGPTIKELIDGNFLSKYKYYAPSVGIETETIKIKCGDYDKKELEFAVNRNKITGDVISHYQHLIPGKRAIIFCVTIEHSKSVAAQFNQAGIPAEVVEGNMPKEYRKAAINRFKSGETLALVNVEIAGEGVDIPAVEAVISLRPTMSEGLYLQQVGRALRVDPDNPGKVAIILDHVGNVYRHGLPDAPRLWSLDGHQRRKNAPGGVGIRYCENCFGCYYPAPVCPYCGTAKDITPRVLAIENGTLAEFDAEQAARAAKMARMEVGQCRTMEDLKRIETERGYQKGWARRMAKIKNIRV